jgi:hypothetical protein
MVLHYHVPLAAQLAFSPEIEPKKIFLTSLASTKTSLSASVPAVNSVEARKLEVAYIQIPTEAVLVEVLQSAAP